MATGRAAPPCSTTCDLGYCSYPRTTTIGPKAAFLPFMQLCMSPSLHRCLSRPRTDHCAGTRQQSERVLHVDVEIPCCSPLVRPPPDCRSRDRCSHLSRDRLRHALAFRAEGSGFRASLRLMVRISRGGTHVCSLRPFLPPSPSRPPPAPPPQPATAPSPPAKKHPLLP